MKQLPCGLSTVRQPAPIPAAGRSCFLISVSEFYSIGRTRRLLDPEQTVLVLAAIVRMEKGCEILAAMDEDACFVVRSFAGLYCLWSKNGARVGVAPVRMEALPLLERDVLGFCWCEGISRRGIGFVNDAPSLRTYPLTGALPRRL
jgi:hypothetical protein